MWPVFLTTREREQHKEKAYDLKIFREFLESCDEKREVAGFYSHEKKNNLWAIIVRAFCQSIDCYLSENIHGFSVLNDKGFSELQGILKVLFLSKN